MLLAPSRVAVRHRSATAQTTASPRTTISITALTDRLSPATQGRLLVLVAFTAFAFAGVLAKAIYATGAEPLSLLLIRFAAAVTVLVLLSRGRLREVDLRTRLKLLAMGAAFSVQSLTFYSAIEMAPVGLVVVVVAVYPVLVVLLDAVIGRRLPGLGRSVLLLVALGGLWLAAGSPTGRPEAGLLLALGCAVIYAVYLKVSESVLAAVSPLVATTYVAAGALTVIGGVVAVATVSWPSPAGVGLAIAHGLFTNALPVVALYAAIRRLGAAGVAGLGPLEPVMGTALAAALLGEQLSATQLIGGAIVLLVVGRLSGLRPRALLPRVPAVTPLRGRAWWREQPEDAVRAAADDGGRTAERHRVPVAGAPAGVG